MKIYTVTEHFYRSVAQLFHQHTVEVLPTDYGKIQADLLIFTGGEDVQPALYGVPNPPHCWFSKERDDWELKVFKDILRGKFRPTKILGICRGLQLINVALGGGLVYDIYDEFNVGHGSFHPITWIESTPLSGIYPVVNSLHHQGLTAGLMGTFFPGKILGIEEKTGIAEAVVWGSNILGVQFHPELMSEALKDKFSALITDWVADRETLCQYPQKFSTRNSTWATYTANT